MKALLEVVALNANDIVTASGDCEYKDCPELEFDDQSTMG